MQKSPETNEQRSESRDQRVENRAESRVVRAAKQRSEKYRAELQGSTEKEHKAIWKRLNTNCLSVTFEDLGGGTVF